MKKSAQPRENISHQSHFTFQLLIFNLLSQEVNVETTNSNILFELKKANKFGFKSAHVSLWPCCIIHLVVWGGRVELSLVVAALWLIVMQSVGSPIDPP